MAETNAAPDRVADHSPAVPDHSGPALVRRHSWAEQIDVLLAGVRCTLDVGPAELVADIGQVLPAAVGPQDAAVSSPPELHLSIESVDQGRSGRGSAYGGEPAYLLFDAGRPVTEPCGADEVLRALEHHVRIWVSMLAPTCLLVHAGVVVSKGGAIVLPAPSRNGKSTLVLALVRAGATYSSDDVAIIDPSGQVWPWPRALRMRRADGFDFPPLPPPAAGPSEVRAVIFSRHVVDGTWSSRPLGPAATSARLLCNTPCARARSAFALRGCTELSRRAPGFEVERGEAADAAGRILDFGSGAMNGPRD